MKQAFRVGCQLLPLALIVLRTGSALAQGVGVGTTTPDASAALDVVSTNRGVLLPRLTQAQRTAISAPATGLLVYQTDGPARGYYYNTGTPATPAWQYTGADNLGNHTATQTLNLGSQALVGTGHDLGGVVGVGVRADGGLNLGQGNPRGGVLLGYQAGQSVTTGNGLVSVGYQAGRDNTAGYDNSFVGTQSGLSNTTGYANTFVGSNSGQANLSAANNTFVGSQSGYRNSTGGSNTFLGSTTGINNTSGGNNTFVGYQAGVGNTSGGNNTFSGWGAGSGNTSGYNNVCTGMFSGSAIGGGTNNVYVGFVSGSQSTGNSNVFVGYRTGYNNVSGENNTALGTNAGPTTDALSNTLALGADAAVNASNKVRLGNTDVTVIEGQVPFSSPSDARFKYDVQANVPGLRFITRLRPVTYRFDGAKLAHYARTGQLSAGFTPDAQAPVQSGFLAQEVEQAAQAVGYRFDGIHAPATARDHYSLAYSQLVVPLVQAVQEQQRQIESLQARNATLEARAAADHTALQTLQAQVARLLADGPQAQR